MIISKQKQRVMSTVRLVPNKNASEKAGKPVWYVPTSTGKMWRVQVSETVSGETRDANGNGTGMNFSRSKVGFSYHQTEDMAKAFVASATKDTILVDGKATEVLMVSGKVIYVDQLVPIVGEDPRYGKQYPYPFTFNGQALDLNQRVAIQAKAIETGLALQQSEKDIYRKKIHTTILDSKDVILSPDNLDDVNRFVAEVLAMNGTSAEEKQARINQLKAIPKAKRTPAEVQLLAELLED